MKTMALLAFAGIAGIPVLLVLLVPAVRNVRSRETVPSALDTSSSVSPEAAERAAA